MRRYKYDFSPRKKKWLRFSHIAYFFFAWNAAAICLYQFFSKEDRVGKDWKSLSGPQKYMSMITDRDSDKKLDVIDLKGFSKTDSKETSIAEFLKERSEKSEWNLTKDWRFDTSLILR